MAFRRQIMLWRSSSSCQGQKWLWSHPSSSQHSRQIVSTRWISSSRLTIEKKTDRSNWESRPKKEDLQFGTTLSDHMLMIEWNKENGWDAPKIVPYQDLHLSPAALCLHYGKLQRIYWLTNGTNIVERNFSIVIPFFPFQRFTMLRRDEGL
jgi:hypothetical protein